MIRLRRLAELLGAADSICLVIHQNPDGDAVGSGSAMFQALTQIGKRVMITCVSDIPAPFSAVVGSLPCQKTLATDADLYLLLDCCNLARSGFSRQLRQLAKHKTVMAIDHHLSSNFDKITEHLFVDNNASATTEIIFRLLSELHVLITPPIATALLLGLYTDTGAFSHSNTSSCALQLASRLVYYGGDLPLINRTFSPQLRTDKQRLWGLVMAELEMRPLGIVVARVKEKHLEQTNTVASDIDGLANRLALIEEANVALVLLETKNDCRGVLRTRHRHVNLGRLARLLGGQGRQKTAGFPTTTTSI